MTRSSPARQDRVYREIKSAILGSRYRMAEKLEAARLADLHGTSVTPVREALFRLMGEGLVDGAIDGGFQVRMITQRDLKDMYTFNQDLLLMSLGRTVRRPALLAATLQSGESAQVGESNQTAGVFTAIYELSRNQQILAVGCQLSESLAGPRAVEPLVLSNVEAELLKITELLRAANLAGLRSAVKAYHRRRLAKISQITTELTMRAFTPPG